MAIALVGSVATGTAATGTSVSATHTLDAGSNRIVLACVTTFDAFGGGTVSGVRYDTAGANTAMTLSHLGTQAVSATLRSYIYYLLEANLPSTGSKTVTATIDGGFSNSAIAVLTLSGANQSAPIKFLDTGTGKDGYYSTDAAVDNASFTLTTSYANSWIVDSTIAGTAITAAPGAGQTERWDFQSSGMTALGSTYPTTTTGNYTVSWTGTTAGGWIIAAAEIRELAGAVAANNSVFFGAAF